MWDFLGLAQAVWECHLYRCCLLVLVSSTLLFLHAQTFLQAFFFFFGFNGRCRNLKRNHPHNTWITFRGSDDTTLTAGVKWSFGYLLIFCQTDWMRHWPQQRLSKVTRLLTADVCLHYLNVLFFALHCLLSNFHFCVCGIAIALQHMISLSNGIHSTFVSIGWVMNLILKLRIPERIALEPCRLENGLRRAEQDSEKRSALQLVISVLSKMSQALVVTLKRGF